MRTVWRAWRHPPRRRGGRTPWSVSPILRKSSWGCGSRRASPLSGARAEEWSMEIPRGIGTIHILGIGGIGMSAIAEILHAKGFTVQGSDQKESANLQRLRAKGIRVFVGHEANNLADA